jgi:hypothetical protein
MNVSTTNYILFRNFRDDLSFFRVNGTAIEEIRYVKYLGLVIDNALRCENHVSSIPKKILPMLYALRKTRFYISEGVAWQCARFFSFDLLEPYMVFGSRFAIIGTPRCYKQRLWRHPSLDFHNSKTLPLGVLCDYSLITIFRMKNGISKCNSLLKKVSNLHDHTFRKNQSWLK